MITKFRDEIKTKLKDDKKLFYLNIMYTAAWLDQHYNPIFKANKITNAQYNVLRILNGSYPSPISVGDIKERIMFKQTDITRMIDRLVEKEFVNRKLCESNRRKMDITISSKGINLLKKINPEIDKIEKSIFNQVINDNDAQEGGNILDKLRNI